MISLHSWHPYRIFASKRYAFIFLATCLIPLQRHSLSRFFNNNIWGNGFEIIHWVRGFCNCINEHISVARRIFKFNVFHSDIYWKNVLSHLTTCSYDNVHWRICSLSIWQTAPGCLLVPGLSSSQSAHKLLRLQGILIFVDILQTLIIKQKVSYICLQFHVFHMMPKSGTFREYS